MPWLGIRTTAEDEALLADLTARYGLDRSGLTRMAWRFLARAGMMGPGSVTERQEHEALHSPAAPDEGCRYCRQEGWV